MGFVLGSQVLEEASGMSSSCAPCMAAKGRGSHPGLLGTEAALGSIKGASSRVPLPELAWHWPEDTREEGLEGPVGFPGG